VDDDPGGGWDPGTRLPGREHRVPSTGRTGR
jgi:hypothetical protein